jgi:hypothetical protein
MGTITTTQISNGQDLDATIVDANFDTVANEINGNIDNANIKNAAAISTTKIDGALKSTKRQDNTTNSTVANQKIQYGYGVFIPNAVIQISETVTFPEAFTTAPVVTISSLGADGGGGTAVTSTNTYANTLAFHVYNVSTTGFTAQAATVNGGAVGNGVITYLYAWTAVGGA